MNPARSVNPTLGVSPVFSGSGTEDAARQAVVDACLAMGGLGINQGKAGNVSVRWDRGGADGMLVTPSALAYERMGIDDVVWLSLALDDTAAEDAQPTMRDGTRPASSEWRMHRDVYAARPEAGAVVHAHPVHAAALACLPRIQRDGIPAFHYMVAVAGGDDIRCAPYATFGTRALSERALTALEGRRACLLAHHGLLACHDSLERALGLAAEVETLCRMYWLALQVGEPGVLDADEMRRVIPRLGGYV